ncbi:hypothetical protein ABFT80_27070 [Mesorhizobium sp. SB112]|uniref:hypothetical protein n=1 Tax=Mesorhizobium sp. SB112 TaxID=3151853 RepID=UPI00326423C3
MTIAVATIVGTCNATSIIDRDPEEISESLAKLTVAAFYCAGNLRIQHTAVDLVWDIQQLMTGVDPDSEVGKKLHADQANAVEKVAKKNVHVFCNGVLADYGPQGNVIAGLVFVPRR